MKNEDELLAEIATMDEGSLRAMLIPLDHQIGLLQRRADYIRAILNLTEESK